MSRPRTMPAPTSREDAALLYVEEIAEQLQRLIPGERCRDLRYLLDMARREAAGTLGRRKGNADSPAPANSPEPAS